MKADSLWKGLARSTRTAAWWEPLLPNAYSRIAAALADVGEMHGDDGTCSLWVGFERAQAGDVWK